MYVHNTTTHIQYVEGRTKKLTLGAQGLPRCRFAAFGKGFRCPRHTAVCRVAPCARAVHGVTHPAVSPAVVQPTTCHAMVIHIRTGAVCVATYRDAASEGSHV